MDEVGEVNDMAYGIPRGTFGGSLGEFPTANVHAYGVRRSGDGRSRGLLRCR